MLRNSIHPLSFKLLTIEFRRVVANSRLHNHEIQFVLRFNILTINYKTMWKFIMGKLYGIFWCVIFLIKNITCATGDVFGSQVENSSKMVLISGSAD